MTNDISLVAAGWLGRFPREAAASSACHSARQSVRQSVSQSVSPSVSRSGHPSVSGPACLRSSDGGGLRSRPDSGAPVDAPLAALILRRPDNSRQSGAPPSRARHARRRTFRRDKYGAHSTGGGVSGARGARHLRLRFHRSHRAHHICSRHSGVSRRCPRRWRRAPS